MSTTNEMTAPAEETSRAEEADRVAAYIEMIRGEGDRFAAVAETADLDADIAACPEWSMRDLVRHVGEIHLWAAANVAAPSSTWLSVADLSDLTPYWPELARRAPLDDELVSWYRATNRNLIDVLESAPLDVAALCFLPAPSPLVMWSRRQASEIAVHRFDAEHASGLDSVYDRSFAADMLDELVVGFAPYTRSVAIDSPRVLLVEAVDVDERWWLIMRPDGITTTRSGRPHDLVISGTAADLYLTLWNRTPRGALELTGDRNLVDLWHRSCRVEWLR